MAFRATRPAIYTRIRSIAGDLKRLCEVTKEASLAGPVSANVILQLFLDLIKARDALEEASAVPGLAEYAQAQEGDTEYDVVAEFQAMLGAIEGLIDWITANISQDGDGYVLVYKWTDDGVTTRSYSTAALSGFRTEIDKVIATID